MGRMIDAEMLLRQLENERQIHEKKEPQRAKGLMDAIMYVIAAGSIEECKDDDE